MNKQKVFISVSSKEKKLGEAFVNRLTILFDNKLEFSLFDIPTGVVWKNKLKSNLEESSILISILTPFYLQSPWAYIEWTPFWLADKHTFIAIPSREMSDSRLDVFKDLQFVFFNEVDKLTSLVNQIKSITRINCNEDPRLIYDLRDSLVNTYDSILKENAAVKYDRYTIDYDLPFADTEKEEYAMHFYQKKDYTTFKQIVEKISSEEVKFEIARKILEYHDIDSFKEMASLLYSGDRLLSLLIYVVYVKDNRDLNYREAVIKQMANIGDNCLMQFLLYMIKNGIDKDGLFETIANELVLDMSKRVVYTALWKNAEQERAEVIYRAIIGNPEKVIICSVHAQNGELEVFKDRITLIANDREMIRLIRHMKVRHNLNYNDYKSYYDLVVNNMTGEVELRDLFTKYNFDFLHQIINDRRAVLGFSPLPIN